MRFHLCRSLFAFRSLLAIVLLCFSRLFIFAPRVTPYFYYIIVYILYFYRILSIYFIVMVRSFYIIVTLFILVFTFSRFTKKHKVKSVNWIIKLSRLHVRASTSFAFNQMAKKEKSYVKF